MKNYCLRIAKFFENGLDAGSWHRDLLGRMTLAIPGLRPPFLSRTESLPVDELRAFRHVFRHLYARPLDQGKVLLVQRNVKPAVESFLMAHRRYQAGLREIAEGLG